MQVIFQNAEDISRGLEKEMSKENNPKIIEERMEKKGFLKRTTHIKAEINGKTLGIKIEHYAKPIDILIEILDYLFPTRFTLKVRNREFLVRKLPFQSRTKVVKVALEAALMEVSLNM